MCFAVARSQRWPTLRTPKLLTARLLTVDVRTIGGANNLDGVWRALGFADSSAVRASICCMESAQVEMLSKSIIETEKQIAEQIMKMSAIRPSPGGFGDVAIAREAAILSGLHTRSAAFRQHLAAMELQVAMKETTLAIAGSADALGHEIATFTTTTDRSTRRLATWTMWLAVVTGLLFVAALVQAFVMWSAAQQILIIPAVKP